MDIPVPVKKKNPVMRGKIHLPILALFLSYLLLFIKYDCELSFKLAYLVCLLCSIFNFSATIILHNLRWSEVTRSILRRIDYAGIFLMIGGSGFPCAIHYMKDDYTVVFSLAHWSVIFFGVFGSLLFNFTSTPKWIRSMIYVLSSLPYFYLVYMALSSRYYMAVACMLLTGFFYSLGSVFYAAQYPNLIPGIFESHELFHLFCTFGFMSSSGFNFIYWRLNKI